MISLLRRIKNRISRFFRGLYDRPTGHVVHVAAAPVTAAAAVAAMTLIVPAWVAIFVFCVVAIHELSHFTTAWLSHGQAWLPLFVPLGIGVMGMTRVDGVPRRRMPRVLYAGPIAGVLTAAVALGAGLTFGLVGVVTVASAVLGYELYAGTLGRDARLARKIRKEVCYGPLTV